MFEDLNTKVHSVRELVAWLDEHRVPTGVHSTAELPAARDAWDPDATGIMQAPQLDRMLAHEQQARASAADDPASVSGSLEAFHVVELLQALSSGDRTGVLELMDGFHFARIHLDKGRISAASFDDDISVEPLEALKRAAAMRAGDFRFGPDLEGPAPGTIVTLSTVQVLIELSTVAWQLAGGEDNAATGELNLDFFDDPSAAPPTASAPAPAPVDLPPVPAFGSRPLTLPDPLLPRLRDLSPDELDVLQAVLRHKTLDRTVVALGEGGERAREVVWRLLARGYLAAG